MNELSLDITIPVLNEERRLEKGVFGAFEFLKKSVVPRYRISVADNGSTDRTEEVAASIQKVCPCFRYIKVNKRGVGLALKKSWNDSDYDIIGYMDVDLATDINHLTEVYSAFQNENIDIVNGSRLLPGSKVTDRKLLRTISSKGYNFLLKFLLDVKFTDGMCGFKFIKKASYNKFNAIGIDNNDWFFCTELLVKAEWLGLHIREIPVRWNDDGDSRVKLFDTIYKYMKEILRLQRCKKAGLAA